jgi:hypothetical protein
MIPAPYIRNAGEHARDRWCDAGIPSAMRTRKSFQRSGDFSPPPAGTPRLGLFGVTAPVANRNLPCLCVLCASVRKFFPQSRPRRQETPAKTIFPLPLCAFAGNSLFRPSLKTSHAEAQRTHWSRLRRSVLSATSVISGVDFFATTFSVSSCLCGEYSFARAAPSTAKNCASNFAMNFWSRLRRSVLSATSVISGVDFFATTFSVPPCLCGEYSLPPETSL